MMHYGLLGDNIEQYEIERTENVSNNDWNICSYCKSKLYLFDSKFQCYSCGYEGVYNDNEYYDYNTISKSYSTSKKLKVSGSHHLSKLMRQGSSWSSNKTFKLKQTMNVMNSCNPKNIQISNVVIDEIVDIMGDIQTEQIDQYTNEKKNFVKRGRKRLGLLAAIMYQIYIKNNNRLCDNIIVEFINNYKDFTKTDLSNGKKLLMELYWTGKYKFNIEITKSDNAWFDSFITNLEIDKKHINLMKDILSSLDDPKVLGEDTSKPASKCAGVISFVCDKLDIDIDNKKIENICNVSYNTYNSFVQYIIINRKLVNKVLLEYNIPKIKKSKNKKSKNKKSKNKKSKNPI
jgi:hypothetical protein